MDQSFLTDSSQNLLTIFVAIVTLAVLIQTGIAAGLLIATLKITQQADRAIAETRRLLGPAHRLVDTMETASLKFSEFSASSRATLRKTGSQWEKTLEQIRRKVA